MSSELLERTMRVNAPAFNAAGKAWRPFAFKNLEKVARSQVLLVERLEWLLPSSAAAGKLTDSVKARLKALFEEETQIFLDYLHVVRPKDLKRYVVDPTFLAVVAPAPHKTRGFLEVELGLAHASIDVLLGGMGEAVTLRPLTDIEEGVMEFITLEALKALAPNLEPGLPRLRLEGIAKGVDDAIARIGDEAQLLVAQFKAVIGTHAGFVRLFIPATVIGMTNPPKNGAERRARRLTEMQQNLSRLAGVKTWLRAEIGRAEITRGVLAGVQGGDVVLLDELSARPDLGEGGTALLRVGLGRMGHMEAEISLEEGRFLATINRFVMGDEPRHSKEPDSQLAADEVEEGEEPEENAHVETPSQETSELLNDIPLQIVVELARVPVSAEDVVALKVGQVLDLNRTPGEPVELSVNGRIVARGELVEVEGHLGVRVLSLAG